MWLTDTVLAMTVSLGVTAAAVSAWSDLRVTHQAVQAHEQLHTQQREVQRLLDRLALSAGATTVAPSANGTWHWVLKPAPLAGTEGPRDDTVTWFLPRELDPRDCQGNQVSTLDLIAHQFKLNTKQELSCKDSQRAGTLFQGLAERVDDFQVLYAQALVTPGDNPALAPLQWRTATQVDDWRQVRALEVCLRWSSPAKLLQVSLSTTGCQGETVLVDGRLHRVQRLVLRLASQGDT